ncbi:MAG: thermonuclease family protein [Geminicoccaceae bacterium]|nr:thermonuclease family protein [Geminicoccaceae bacterium]
MSGAVVEGPDRLRLADGRIVRLLGLVVPGDLSPAPAGPERVAAARRRLEELVAAGPLELEGLGEDRLGRVLGKVRTADGRLFQRELVAAGLAWAFPDGLDRASARELLAAEAEARAARRGLWAEPSLAVQDAARVTAEPVRFAVVEGEVVDLVDGDPGGEGGVVAGVGVDGPSADGGKGDADGAAAEELAQRTRVVRRDPLGADDVLAFGVGTGPNIECRFYRNHSS